MAILLQQSTNLTQGKRWSLFEAVFLFQLVLLSLVYSQATSFYENLTSPLFYTCLLINVFFALTEVQKNFLASGITFFIIAIILGYQAVFSIQYGTEFTGKFLGTFPGLCMAGVFSVSLRRQGIKSTLFIIYISCIIYLFIYLYLLNSIDAYAVMQQQMVGGKDVSHAILRAHGSETAASGHTEYRIKTSGFHMAYALLYPICMFSTQRRWIIRSALAIGAAFATYCLWKADFRFNLLATLIGAITIIIPTIPGRLKEIGAFSFLVLNLFLTILFWIIDLNPYKIFSGDETGAVRISEFEAGMAAFRHVPLFGTGLPGKGEDYQLPFGNSIVAPSDIGYFGELIQHGVFGIILLFFSHWIIFRIIIIAGRHVEIRAAQSLMLGIFVYTVFAEILMTVLWEGGASIILSLAIAALGMPIETLLARPRSGQDSTSRT